MRNTVIDPFLSCGIATEAGTTIEVLPPIADPIEYFVHCIYYILYTSLSRRIFCRLLCNNNKRIRKPIELNLFQLLFYYGDVQK